MGMTPKRGSARGMGGKANTLYGNAKLNAGTQKQVVSTHATARRIKP